MRDLVFEKHDLIHFIELFLILFVLAFKLTNAGALYADNRQNNYDSTKRIEYAGSPDTTRFIYLKYPFLLNQSVKVKSSRHGILDSSWYLLFPREAKIQMKKSLLADDSLVIQYHALPIMMQKRFKRWHHTDNDSADTKDSVKIVQPSVPADEETASLDETLKRSGSIFRGISLGTNQGMRLQSGLRLQLSGQIAPNVEVIGSLTDQNTPIQPEGNTQTLQEIDKVFIQVKTPAFQSTMGDYVFEAADTEFASFSRKLQGATASAEYKNATFSVLAGASKGEFNSNNFNGSEGNQGPYQLTGSKGQREIIVLAGTERVWIDGERMARGENSDYVIEYGNGQITFTRNRLITGDSRITVDFEYSDQKFQKLIYGAAGKMHFWKNRLQIETTFLREADDKDNPLDIPLTDDYKAVLSEAGDVTDSSVVSGGIYLGENKAEYKKTAENGKTIYQYVGAESGDYRVRFSYVGSGQGDYTFQGYGIFRYEGEGQGEYLPVIFLPLASAHQIADAKMRINISNQIDLNTEVAFSDQDLNLYSALDDHNNFGTAYKGALNLNDIFLGKFGKQHGKISLHYKGKHVSDQFRPVGRVGEVEYGRKWGSETNVTWGEATHEMTGQYQVGKWADVMAGWGRLKKGNHFMSDRKMFRSEFQKNADNCVKYQAELIDTDNNQQNGYWLRQQGNARFSWKGWQPVFAYEGEHRKNESTDSLMTGFQFHDYKGKIVTKKLGGLWEFSESIRTDQKYQMGTLAPYSTAKTDRVAFSTRNAGGLSTSLHYTHRFRDYNDPDLQDQNSDLAHAEMQWKPRNGFLNTSLNYQFSSTRVSEMVRDTIEVGEGLGNYRFDEALNEFVPDADGNLIFRMIQTGAFIPVNELRLNFDIRMQGERLFKSANGIKKVLKSISTRTQLRLDRKDKMRDFSRVNRMALSPDWGNDTTLVSGYVSLYQDIEYRPRGKARSLRLRFRQDNTENRQFVNEGQLRRFQELSLRYKDRIARKFGVLVEFENKCDDKNFFSISKTDKNIAANQIVFEASYRPASTWDVAIRTEYRHARNKVPEPVSEARAFFLIPRVGFSFKQKGRLRAELEFGQVSADPENRALPYEMLQGDQPGKTMRWSLFAAYQISGHVMITLNYRGRNEPWRTRIYQTGQLKVRAFF